MLIELLVGAGLVTLGVAAVRALRRRVAEEDPPKAEASGSDAEKPGQQKAGTRPRSPRGLRTDDVLLYADDELWLAGEIHLDEEGFALSLFRTPGSARHEWVAQLDAAAEELVLLGPTDEVPGGAIPTELPIEGLRLRLSRRGHADVRTCGEQLPKATERARYAVLAGPGGRTLVVVDFDGGERLALVGERVPRAMLDLLPGGEAR